MQQFDENDGIEELGWFVAMLAACGFLFIAIVFCLTELGLL